MSPNDKNLEKEERLRKAREEVARNKRNRILKRVGLWGGTAVLLGAMVFGLAKLGSTAPGNSGPGTLSEPVSGQDHSKGNSLAKVTFVEYSDFECPACRNFYTSSKNMIAKYQDRVLFVYRHFPLPQHVNGFPAAKASEAAAKQGKFWEMHDMLYDNQDSWTGIDNPETEFEKFANRLQLDMNKYRADYDSRETEDRINRDISSGDRSNVNSTPSFYINGNKITNLQNYGDLERAIEEALAQSR